MKHLIVSIYDSGYGFNVTIIDNKKVIDYYPCSKLNIATSLQNKYDKYNENEFENYLRNTYGDEYDTICIIENASTTIIKGEEINVKDREEDF